MAISFMDSILTELDTRFATDKRAHLELGVLVTELITKTKFRRNCKNLDFEVETFDESRG